MLALDNVTFSPHMAGVTAESLLRILQAAMANCNRVARGEITPDDAERLLQWRQWQVAQQVYADAGHYEWDNLPNWTALRQKASAELNKLLSSCGDTRSALSTLNGDLQGHKIRISDVRVGTENFSGFEFQ